MGESGLLGLEVRRGSVLETKGCLQGALGEEVGWGPGSLDGMNSVSAALWLGQPVSSSVFRILFSPQEEPPHRVSQAGRATSPPFPLAGLNPDPNCFPFSNLPFFCPALDSSPEEKGSERMLLFLLLLEESPGLFSHIVLVSDLVR